MKVLICTSRKKEKSIEMLPAVIGALCENGITPLMHADFKNVCGDSRVEFTESDNPVSGCDIVLTVGGDGTILKWGKKSAAADKPLVGVNTGRLGFMAALGCDEAEKLSALKTGGYSITKRMLLDTKINGEKQSEALNDIVLFKDVNSKLPEYIVKVNGITITKIRADGLIISTPTGSTAYALSAGGPIIEPTAECIQLTPLCAHSLFNRPMIFSASDSLTVSYNSYEGSQVNVSIDGGSGIRFGEKDTLEIVKSSLSLKLIDINGHNFYEAVSTKLLTPLK